MTFGSSFSSLQAQPESLVVLSSLSTFPSFQLVALEELIHICRKICVLHCVLYKNRLRRFIDDHELGDVSVSLLTVENFTARSPNSTPL